MPLQDSFSSRRPSEQSSVPHAPKPNRLPKPPAREDLEFTLSCAQGNPNVPLGLLWRKAGKAYLLTVFASSNVRNAEAAWVLNAGTASERSVLWSYKSADIDFILEQLQDLDASQSQPVEAREPIGLASGEFLAWEVEFPMHDPLVETGSIFADQYEIISEIGSGGMGMVYKARDNKFDRIVAVKVLHGHLVTDPISKKRFEQEAKAALSLSHPNLISLYHYGFSAAGLPFLVMDFVDGIGLDELLLSKHRLDLEEFLDIFVQSCLGLGHAHAKGIIHRDLKPSNVMLLNEPDQRVHVKIVDFGIAKILDKEADVDQALTVSGDIVGSPLYMSPEQCKGDTLDARSDIYSLGCLMYHAVSGVVPFEGETTMHTLGKQMCDAPDPFAVVAPDLIVPNRLQDLIFKCLEKDPSKRYASVQEVQEELKQIQNAGSPSLISSGTLPIWTISQLLVDSGDLPATTLHAALKVQKMLRAGSLTLNQAADALGRAHLAGGQILLGDTGEYRKMGEKGIETPVEAILVEAGLITNSMWRTLLSLQQKIRSGQLTKEDALEELQKLRPQTQKSQPVSAAVKDAQVIPKDVLEMLKHSGIVSAAEIEEAARVANEEGTDLAKRLVSIGRVDNKTLLAARQCLSLMESDRLRIDRAVIALQYCHRSRVGFYEAVEELGWERP